MAFTNPAARFDIRADDKTKTAFASVKANMASVTSAANLMRASMALVAGAAGVGLMIKKSLDAADSIGKMSDAVGVSTDTLQELRYAADLAGISQEKLDKAMVKFAKGVGEARSETGTLVTILRKMDEELLRNIQSASDTDEAFNIMMNAVAGMGNELDKTALLAAAFGSKAGPQMAVLLKDGVEGLNAVRQQAHDLGLIMDEDLIRKSEQAKDELTRLTSVIKTKITAALIELAPHIIVIAQNLTEAASKSGDFGDAVIDAAEDMGMGIGVVLDLMHQLLIWISTAEVGIKGLAASPLLLLDKLGIEADVIEEGLNDVGAAIVRLEELTNAPLPSEGIKQFFADVRAEAELTKDAIRITGGNGDERSAAEIAEEERLQKELERMRLQAASKLEILQTSIWNEQEAETQAHLNRMMILEENFELENVTLERYYEIREGLEQKHQNNLDKIQKKAGDGKIKLQQQISSQVMGIIRQLGSESEAFAKAAIVIEAAIAAKKIIIESQVAAAAALVPPPVGLGPVAGQALAAQILTMGKISAGLAIAQGALSLGSVGGGDSGGGAFGSTQTTQIDPVTGIETGSASSPPQTTEITVNLGDSIGSDFIRAFIDQINDEIDDGVVIGSIKVA